MEDEILEIKKVVQLPHFEFSSAPPWILYLTSKMGGSTLVYHTQYKVDGEKSFWFNFICINFNISGLIEFHNI